MDCAAIGVKVGIDVLNRISPKGLSWLTTCISGKKILFLGPGGAGKTSFVEYMEFGALEPESDHNKTHSVRNTPTFEISMGRERALKLRVKKVTDTSGQVGAVAHAELVGQLKPHAVMIMLDLSGSTSTSEMWIKEFCEHLDSLSRSKKFLSNIKTFIVVLNKRDKLNEAIYNKHKASTKASVTTNFEILIGAQRAKDLRVMPCITIENNDGAKYIDAIIRQLAKELVR
jgi:GTPase SAR1 family protein